MLFRSWTAADTEGGWYAAVFNAGDKDSVVRISLDDLEISGEVSCTELWSGSKEKVTGEVEAELESHGAKAFYLR